MKRAIYAALCALPLAGCVTSKVYSGPPVTVEELIRQIKHDVGEYNAYAEAHVNDAPLNTACGGKIDLTVKAVTVSVTTTAKASEGGSVGAQIVPGPVITKLGASAGVGSSIHNSQGLTFTLVPVSDRVAQASELAVRPVTPSQLYLVLTGLRESLLKASDTTPCLAFPEEGQKNTVEFGFQATKSSTMSAGINLWIFAIGASRGDERTAAHTIKISFEGAGQAFQ